jgi:pimeloyl-ACP methyl ester carboxylesterase
MLLKYVLHFIVIVFSLSAANAETMFDNIKRVQNGDNPYQQDLIIENFQAALPSHQSYVEVYGRNTTYKNIYLFAKSQKHKAPFVIVYLHGLGVGPYQYATIANRLEHKGVNQILMRLAGHGKEPRPVFTRSQWYREVRKILLEAKRYGEKTIVVGQSTGGILAIREAILEPNLIDGLVLIEPAIKVKSYLDAAGCVGSSLYNNLYQPFRDAFVDQNQPTEPDFILSPSWVVLGCEVAAIRRDLQAMADKSNSEGELERWLAEKTRVKTILYGNISDEVVDLASIVSYGGYRANYNRSEILYRQIDGPHHGSYKTHNLMFSFDIEEFIDSL